MQFGEINHLILFGGGGLLAGLLSRAKAAGWSVDVVTSERHLDTKLEPLSVTLRSFLEEGGFKWIVSNDVNTDPVVHDLITSQTLGISMGAAWLFKAAFIERFAGRLVNVHGARLPQDRGGGGYSWRILRNDRLGYSLVHMIDAGVDTGDIVTYTEYFFPESCRVPADYREQALAKDLETLDQLLTDIQFGKEFHLRSQLKYLSSYWPRLNTDAHAFVDWNWDLKEIEQFICAFDDPYAGAQTYVGDQRVRLKNCMSITVDGTFHPFQPGMVYRISAGALFIATRQGTLVVSTVGDDDANDLLPKIRVGDRFYTPTEQIDSAKRFRAIYTPHGLKI